MGSPALALGWQFWARHRRGLCILIAYFAALGFVGPFLGEEAAHTVAPLVVLIPTFFALVYLLAVFSHGFDNVRVDAVESGFPRWMLTLPAPAGLLVGCPLLLGGGLLVLFWLAYSAFILRGWHLESAPVWPGFLLAALLAWVQALVWRPFALPWLRLPVLALAVGLIVALCATLVAQVEAPEWLTVITLAALTGWAYAVAVRGVARARRGEVPDQTRWLDWLRERAGVWRRPGRDFASGWQAQLWLERRQHGLPLLLGGIVNVVLVLTCLGGARETLRILIASGMFPELTALAEVFPAPWLLLLGYLSLPGFLAVALSADTGRLDLSARRRMSLWPVRISAFLASRPVTSLLLAEAKWHAAGRAVLLGWAMHLIGLAVYLFALGGLAELSERLPDVLRGRPPLELATLYGAVLLTFIVLTGIALTQGMWAGLSGRLWLIWPNLCVPVALGLLFYPSVHHLYTHPEQARRLGEALAWLLPLGVGLKVVLAGWLGGRVLRQGLASRGFLARVFLAWVVLGLALAGVLAWLLPAEVAGRAVLAWGCLVAMPLSRFVAAPLAAEWNRRDA